MYQLRLRPQVTKLATRSSVLPTFVGGNRDLYYPTEIATFAFQSKVGTGCFFLPVLHSIHQSLPSHIFVE